MNELFTVFPLHMTLCKNSNRNHPSILLITQLVDEALILTFVVIVTDENFPPKADAGGDRIVTLPAWLVCVNGSKSSDDKNITDWKWSRDEQSLAAGVS